MKPSVDVTAVVVTWNSRDDIAFCLRALQESRGVHMSIVVVDNASVDGTIPFVQRMFPEITTVQEPANRGFAQANNDGFERASTTWVLTCNPDVVVDAACITALLAAVQHSPHIGAAGPLLYRTDDLAPPFPRTTIDSTGLLARRQRSIEDRGAGESANAVPLKPETVFGVTAACALFRRAALDDVAVEGTVFDPDFGSYKEDVDLAWRLQRCGWDALFVPSAVAWHRRGVRSAPKGNMRRVRTTRSRRERFLSYRNHLYTLWKNESFRTMLHPRVLWYEWRKAVYALFFEPYTLLALPAILWKLPRLLRQRNVIRRHSRRQPRDMDKWFA
ncbi:MAG: glycosyltransferase family 2 protein [Candidatus Kerfeldbacteria bacterium]|nr:glycosyltransferase family 2 protein [Candidatus Kerfeldbacteria bacterium]